VLLFKSVGNEVRSPKTNGLARDVERKAVVRLPQAATEDYSGTLRFHPSGVRLPLAAGVRTYHLVLSGHNSPLLGSGLPAGSAVRLAASPTYAIA